jgi:dTDP-4-amino-4,6-dideoxygalactose transaminase
MNDSLPALLGGVPVVNIQREFRWPIITEADIAAVTELLRQGLTSDTGYSEPVRRFEEAWARYLGVEFALSRVDGTSSLHSALFAAGVRPGDEVIVQSYTWIATAGCILAAGAIPIFADIDPRTYTLDPADVERRITPRTKAILAVHLWGHPADMDALCDIAARHGLVVIEDAAHAHGGLYKGRKTSTIGDIGCFSFQNTKAVPAGEGGMMVTSRREYFERALLLTQSPARLHMHIKMEEHLRFRDTGFGGFKYRINPLNAAMAVTQMERFEEYNRIRQENLDALTEMLRAVPGVIPPYTAPEVTRGGYYGYPILYEPRELDGLPLDTFLAAVQAEGVPLARERYPMLHLTAMFREHNPLGGGWPWNASEAGRAVHYAPGDLPVTEDIYPRLLAIVAFNKAVPCQDLFAQYAAAFRKVAANARRLKGAAVSA